MLTNHAELIRKNAAQDERLAALEARLAELEARLATVAAAKGKRSK